MVDIEAESRDSYVCHDPQSNLKISSELNLSTSKPERDICKLSDIPYITIQRNNIKVSQYRDIALVEKVFNL